MPDTATTRTPIPLGTWVIDRKHTTVGFQVKHMGIATVRGQFNAFEGRLEVTEDGATASGSVDAASVDTNEPKRDAHLRSPDFFDVERFPRIAFASTAIQAVDEDTLTITGDLTLHGITRALTLQATVGGSGTDPWSGEERVALEVVGHILRSDYEMRFNQALGGGNVLVSDKVKLVLDISAVKQA